MRILERVSRPARPALLAALLAASGCVGPVRLARDLPDPRPAVAPLGLPDPAAAGPFAVGKFYYGSGTDRRRIEYRDSVRVRTTSVDATKLLPQYERNRKWARRRHDYWGFGPDSLPRNGRVWHPAGDTAAGPFPLVLIVHGNHDMKDFSDPGYAYLGERLASRGYIVASVDENFLNGDIRGENNARGWMLLKHLELFREWNDAGGHPLQGRIDLDRIALIGHSRGGESAAHAASFNRLRRYPDDANIPLGFDFAIRAVIAIAPSDGQYRPADRLEPLENVNYLVLHGSHDGDVSIFQGLRQYQRVRFTDDAPWFKAAMFIYRANHGQFNTGWGRRDIGESSWVLDTRALLDDEEQRRVGLVTIGAFLESALRDRREYLELFRDPRTGREWLPGTIYLARYEDAGTSRLATYEEDVDVTTATAAGGRFEGDSLAIWKESVLSFRSKQPIRQENAVVTLGWTRRIAGVDSLAPPPSYVLTLPEFPKADSASALVFDVANLGTAPAPRAAAVDGSRRGANPDSTTPADTGIAVDFTIELTSAAASGPRTVRTRVSRFAHLRPPLIVQLHKWRRIERARVGATHEIVLQTVAIPLADLARGSPEFDLSRVSRVRFVFDRTAAGTIVLDNVGIASLMAPSEP